MTEKDKPILEDEIALFREAMKDVKPIKVSHHYAPLPKPDENSLYRRFAATHFSRPAEEEKYAYPLETRHVSLPFSKNGFQRTLLQKMKRGQLTIEARLDLHGYKPQTAWERVNAFIHAAQEAGIRHVLIVHGRGSGILKRELLNWLYDAPAVLACCEAGEGAVKVIIKKLG